MSPPVNQGGGRPPLNSWGPLPPRGALVGHVPSPVNIIKVRLLFPHKCPSLTLTPRSQLQWMLWLRINSVEGWGSPLCKQGVLPRRCARGRMSACRCGHVLPQLTAPDRYLNMNLRAALMWKRADTPTLCPGSQFLWQTQRPVRVIPVGAGRSSTQARNRLSAFLG